MSRTIPFTKMHGAGNDFVVLDGVSGPLPPVDRIARRLADRHFGIGCDQILVVRPSASADFRMEIFNADGSQVEMCANGIRAFFKYVRDHGLTAKDEIGVETLGGIVRPRWAGPDRIAVDMGRPVLAPAKIPVRLGSGEGPVLDVALDVDAERLCVSAVSMGNPHCVLFVPSVDAAPVTKGDAARDALVRQVSRSVRWDESITRMAEDGVKLFVEIGVGSALTGMIKRTVSGPTAISVQKPDDFAAAIEAIRKVRAG